MLLQINTLPKQLWRVRFSDRKVLIDAQKDTVSYGTQNHPRCALTWANVHNSAVNIINVTIINVTISKSIQWNLRLL